MFGVEGWTEMGTEPEPYGCRARVLPLIPLSLCTLFWGDFSLCCPGWPQIPELLGLQGWFNMHSSLLFGFWILVCHLLSMFPLANVLLCCSFHVNGDNNLYRNLLNGCTWRHLESNLVPHRQIHNTLLIPYFAFLALMSMFPWKVKQFLQRTHRFLHGYHCTPKLE